MSSSFYITTAIDYVNGEPHLGHAYEKISADVIARWQRLSGKDVRYLTGTDEHGIKVQKTAAAAGLSPQDYVNSLVPAFQEAWDLLDVSYDRFIRTTDADHEKAVTRLLETIKDKGHLRVETYKGWYCEGCEAFKTERDLKDGKCPVHQDTEPRWLEEENLFFALSAFTEPLLAHFEKYPEFVAPPHRRNEVLGILKEGLQDLSVSRSKNSVSWGIPISFRPDSVIYVWFDALINYLTGAGYGSDKDLLERYWPCDLHIIGKDILRFHCIIWPAMLMAADLPLPKQVFAHGWVLTGGEKMSKSSGISVEPRAIAKTYGADALRYFLCSEITYGRDGEFSWQRFEEVYTAHLANGLGNLLSRSIGMATKYFGGVPAIEGAKDPLLAKLCTEVSSQAIDAYERCALHEACAQAWRIVTTCNEQIQAREPWKMAKDESRSTELQIFLYSLMEALRIAAHLLSPILPGKTKQCLAALGSSRSEGQSREELLSWGGIEAGRPLERPQPLFPRLDQLLLQADESSRG